MVDWYTETQSSIKFCTEIFKGTSAGNLPIIQIFEALRNTYGFFVL